MSLVSDPAVPLLMCRTLLKSTYDEASAAQANSTNKIINDRVLSVCNELKQKIHQIEMDENLKEKIFKVVDEESSNLTLVFQLYLLTHYLRQVLCFLRN